MVTPKHPASPLIRSKEKRWVFRGDYTTGSDSRSKRDAHQWVVRGADGSWRIDPLHKISDDYQVIFSSILDPQPEEAEEIAQSGVPADFIYLLAHLFSRTPVELAQHIGLSRTTLDRKVRDHTHLDFIGSDRTMRYARLLKLALDVWETEDAAREWLNAPNRHLGGATPFNRASTDAGYRQIEDLLGQIAHGVLP